MVASGSLWCHGGAVRGALDPDAQLGYLLVRAADQVSRPWLAALREHGINPRQFSVLSLLVREPELSQGELARRVMITPQSMGESLTALLEARLLVREEGGPGLPSLHRVTASGQALLRRAYPVVERTNRDAFLTLTASEQRTFARLLQKVLGASHLQRAPASSRAAHAPPRVAGVRARQGRPPRRP